MKLNNLLKGDVFTPSYFKSNFMDVLPNPDLILRRTGKTIETYRELKNDAHIWSCIQSRKSGTLSLEFSIMPSGCNQEIVKIIEDIFQDLDLQQIIRDILEAPLFGYQPMEIIWNITNNGIRIIYPQQIIAKPQEWFAYDNNGKIKFNAGLGNDIQEIDEMKILDVRYEASYLNPYGTSLLAKCYWPLTFKNGGLRFWVNFTEKYGMPIMMGKYNRGATQKEIENLANVLADMAEDSVLVTPVDIDLELHEAAKSTSVELYRELIKYCNAEISKAILSQTLTTELDMGSYAAAQTHFKVRKEVILADIKLVENTLDKVIKYIIDLNFGSKAYPKFKITLNDADNQQKIERDIKLVQAGMVQFSKKYLMDNYGFKEGDFS